MAKTTKKRPTAKPNARQLKTEAEQTFSVKKVVKDERTHKISGFMLVLLSILLGLALVSYCFTWQYDQDKVFSATGNFLFAKNMEVRNLLGWLGAWVSHVLVFKGFGLASFLLCTLPFVWGINLIFGKPVFSLVRNVVYVATGLIILSVAAHFFTQGNAFSYGGAVGRVCSTYLVAMIGSTGTALVLILVVVAWVIWRFNPSFKMPERKPKPEPIEVEEDIEVDVVEDVAKFIDKTAQGRKKQPPTAPIIPAAPAFQPTAAGKTLNDLYAEGQIQHLSGKWPENISPLDEQKVAGGENTVDDDSSVAVMAPESRAKKPDPMVRFDVIETTEPDAPFAGIPMPVTNAPIAPDNPVGNIAVQLPPEQPAPTPRRPLKQEHEKSDLELEIKPSAERNSHEETAETDGPTSGTNLEPYDPLLDLRDYKMPHFDLLETHGSEKIVSDPAELEANKNQILGTLKNYDISIQRISATVGPTVTLYEIVPAPGVRISRIKNLEDDIALSLAALGIRIIAPIPGKGTIGIEVPNVRKSIVSMRTLLSGEKFQNSSFSLPIALGKKIDNEHFVVDLASMPHLLMAGATGQGKSVGINAILVSLLYKKHPSQMKLVLVDPKKVELSLYRIIERHFLAKLPGEDESIITDTKKVVHTLNALCIEMDNRYDLLKEAGVRNIKEYNEKFTRRKLSPQKGHQYLPFIVLVVDEFADLIMTAGKEIEMPIARLAQLARAVGIHLIIATQRPSVNIITGTIKANFPSRVAFKVSSKIDSRTILDAGGAEQLIGKGDMLISHNGELIRLQCAFVDTPEVERVAEFIGAQRGYPDAFLLPEYVDEKEMEAKDFDLSDRDKLFDEAARLIVQNQSGSTSLIQRRMKLGYNRAGRLMDQLEGAGIVGPNQGSKPREVLVHSEMELEDILGRI
jgi:S-DNA-T family DNA segregation ATPase FtsK/SpoIIIE